LRYKVQQQSKTTTFWRTRLSTPTREEAEAAFSSLIQDLPAGVAVRLLDEHHDLVLAAFSRRLYATVGTTAVLSSTSSATS
jgi:hypothetical protein